MRRFFFPLLLFLFFFLSYSQKGGLQSSSELRALYLKAEKIYKEANRRYDNAGDNAAAIKESDSLYHDALVAFTKLIPELEKNQIDSLALKAAFYTAIIHHSYDSLQDALGGYLKAIQIKNRNTQLPDSIIFQPLIFSGSIYYKMGNYDSAIYYYEKAEIVKKQYTALLDEEPRLYNLLGIIHYETGNLRQAVNYIEKAIETMQQAGNNDEILKTNYQLNLVSAHIRLEEYDKAKIILEKISSGNIYTDEIKQKQGYIALKENNYQIAIYHFSSIKPTASKKLTELFIDKSIAFKGLKLYDSSAYYLQRARAEYSLTKNNNSEILLGLILKTEAELAVIATQQMVALPIYQQAIIRFCNNFSDTAISANPANFTGTFSYFDLFNSLIAKAEVLESIYKENKSIQSLEASLNAYESAYKLSSYIEATYNSDEARLFLNKLKYNNHHKPIDVSIKLFDLTKKIKYLEDAYYFDQVNKASALTSGMSESSIKPKTEKTKELTKQIATTKTNITRLSLAMANASDSGKIAGLNSNIREEEIVLENLQKEVKQQPEWKNNFQSNKIPAVAEVQKELSQKSTILSYHLSEQEILIFIINRNNVSYKRVSIDSIFYQSVNTFKQALHNVKAGSRYDGSSLARYLFSVLIKPVQYQLLSSDHLIIIPDDELNYLPFEALQDENDKYLLQNFSTQYIFSTSLFNPLKNYNKNNGTLSFAPFASNSYNDVNGNNFARLAASLSEVQQSKGLVLTDAAATKEKFIREANRYPIIHLATHAVAATEEGKQSFIVFSPVDSNYKLYSSEINNLQLDSTDLIILSACETGAGRLVKGEGLMSLSRAFAYAGCRNIVTSLWRAEDAATAFITRRLHRYIAMGFRKSEALQQAKVDLLKSDEISPQLKSPNYWAHLIFIGSFEDRPSSSNWVWIAAIIMLAGIAYLIFKKIKSPGNRASISN